MAKEKLPKSVTDYFRKIATEASNKLTPAQRKERARKAAQARWKKTK